MPVPIPNTEAKLPSADESALLGVKVGRRRLFFFFFLYFLVKST